MRASVVFSALFAAAVLCGTADAERNDPPAVTLPVGTAPYAPALEASAADCETKYFSVSVPGANGSPESGFLRLESRQNSSGSAAVQLQSVHRPTDSDLESSCTTAGDGDLCRIDALCNFGANGRYFVGVKGTDVNEVTDVLVNATVSREAARPLAVDGTYVRVESKDHPTESYSYDFFRATFPRQTAATIEIAVRDVEDVPVTVFVNADGQAGPDCNVKSKTCGISKEECVLEITPCAYPASGEWFVTVRSQAPEANLTSVYEIAATASRPEVQAISNGYNGAGSVLPGEFRYYRLPVNRSDEQIAVRLDAVNRGDVVMSLDFETPLGPGCVSASTCTGGTHTNAICYLEVPFCETQVGDYFVVVKGEPNDRDAPITYTLEVLAFSPVNATAQIGVPLSSTVSTSQFSEYAVVIPDNVSPTAELAVRVYTPSTTDKVTVTASNSYEGTCETASSSSASDASDLVTDNCATSGADNDCMLIFKTCSVTPGTWWIKVEGVAPQLSDIPFTLSVHLREPKALKNGESVPGVASNTAFTHYKFTVPPHQNPVAVVIELDSVSGHGVQILTRQGHLAGCDECYSHFGPGTIAGSSGVNIPGSDQGTDYTTEPSAIHLGPYFFPSAGGDYYIAARGSQAEATRYTMTFKIVEASAETAAFDADVIKSIDVGALHTYALSPTADEAVFADMVFNPVSSAAGTDSGEVTVALYNSEFTWSEYEQDWDTLPDPDVYVTTTVCSLTGSTTTSCSIDLTRCRVKPGTGWRLAIWPYRRTADNENDAFDYTLRARQPTSTPMRATLGTPVTKEALVPLGSSHTEYFYYTLDVPASAPGDFLEVSLFSRTNASSISLHLASPKERAAGELPLPCGDAARTCSLGSSACSILVEPCELAAGTWGVTVAVGGISGSQSSFSFTVDPKIKSAKPLASGRGETGNVRKGSAAHYMLSYPALKNEASFLDVDVVSVDNTSPVTVRINRGSPGLAGCSECLTYTESCTTSADSDGSNRCRIRISPCEFVASGDLFLAVTHDSGAEGSLRDFTLTATVWEADASVQAVSTPVTGTADAITYTVYKFDIPQALVGKASMSVIIQDADGTEPFDMYVVPATGGPAVPAGMHPNPDVSRCAATQCTNTTETPCPDLNYPVNDVPSWLVGVKGTGAEVDYTIQITLNAVRDLTNGQPVSSTLEAGAFETFRYPVPGGAVSAGGYLELVLEEVGGGGVEVRLNGDSPVRRSYPGGASIEYETAVSVIRTTGSSELCPGEPSGDEGCTILAASCETGATQWYVDVKAPSAPKNVSEYTITANYRTATPASSGYYANVPFGDAAYKTISIPATAEQYVTVFANTTDAGGVDIAVGEVDSSAAKCDIITGKQFGPCCKTASNVIAEFKGAARFNNSAKFNYEVQVESPREIPTAEGSPALSSSVRMSNYRHFFVQAPPNSGPGRWLVVTADGLDGSLYINPNSPAGDGACLEYQFRNNTCSGSGICTVNIEPCQVPDAGGKFYVAVYGSNVVPVQDFTLSARFLTLNETNIVSGENLAGTLEPFQYREFILTVQENLGPLAYLEFQTQPPPPKAPNAPEQVNATASDTEISITVSWDAAEPNGAPVTQYRVYESVDGAAFPTNPTYTTNGATSLVLTAGQIQGETDYAYAVAAVNSVGASEQSVSSPTVTTIPGGAPDIPAAPSVSTPSTDADTTAFISWSAPADNGSPLTSYAVQSQVNGTDTWSAPQTVQGDPVGSVPPTSHLFNGLTADTTYYFRVRATNAKGSSNYSIPSAPFATAAPATAATAPTALSAALVSGFEDSQVELSWTAPSDDGGSQVSDYSVARFIDGVADGQPQLTGDGQSTTFVDSTVAASTNYTYTVTAINGAGSSPPSDSSNRVLTYDPIPRLPGAPTSVTTSSVQSASVTVSWTAPAELGTPNLNDYTVQSSLDGGASWGQDTTVGGTGTTFAFTTGISGGNSYNFRVRADNTDGPGPWSDASAQVTTPAEAPSAPTNVVPSGASDNEITVSWVAPTTAGSPAFTTYEITQSADGGQYQTSTTTPATIAAGTTQATVTNLAPGTSYTFVVSAIVPNGGARTPSAASSALSTTGTPAPTNPDPVTNVAIAARPGSEGTAASVSWTAPVFLGNSPLVAYEVTFTSTPSASGVEVTGSVNVTASATSITLTNLQPGTDATVDGIVVYTEYGASGASSSATMTLEPVPSTPPQPGLQFLQTGPMVITNAESTGTSTGAEISRAVVEYQLTSGTTWTAATVDSTQPATIPNDNSAVAISISDAGIVPGVEIVVRVAFVNAWGQSEWSPVSDPQTYPNARRLRRAADGSAVGVLGGVPVVVRSARAAGAAAGGRALLADGDLQLDVIDGMWIQKGGSHAGRASQCQTRTSLTGLSQVPEDCNIPGYCDLITLCDSPALTSGQYRIMIYNPSPFRSTFEFEFRVVDPAVNQLALNNPVVGQFDKFGASGFTFTSPPADTVGYVHFLMSNTEPGTTLSLGDKCTQTDASCTVLDGDRSCLIQVPACNLDASGVFLKITGGESNGNATVLATVPPAVSFTANTVFSSDLKDEQVTKVLYSVDVNLASPDDFVDVQLLNVDNGTVAIDFGVDGPGVACGGTSSCQANSDQIVPACHARAAPCAARSGKYYVIARRVSGWPTFDLKVSTVQTPELSYLPNDSDDYLFNDQHLRYRIPVASANTSAGSFLVVNAEVSNAAVSSCTHGVSLSVYDSASGGDDDDEVDVADNCDLSDSSLEGRVVDTCSFHAGDWYISARGNAAPGIDSPVNYRVTASFHEVALIPLYLWRKVTWKRPDSYDTVVEYSFDVDSTVTSGSRIGLVAEFDVASGETLTIKLNRDYRIGYEADLDKSCLGSDSNRFKRSVTCSTSPCYIQVSQCELAAATYFARITSTSGISEAEVYWAQIDNNVKQLAEGSKVTGVAVGGEALQQYRIDFNATGDHTMLQVRLKGTNFESTCGAKLFLMRGSMATSGCNVAECSVSPTGSADCVARASVGTASSSGASTCVAPEDDATDLTGTWFAAVEGACPEEAGVTYTLELSQTVQTTELELDARTCGTVGDWGITGHSIAYPNVQGAPVSILSTSYNALTGSSSAYTDLDHVAGMCSGTGLSECLSTNSTYLSAIGDIGGTYEVYPSITRQAPLPFDLDTSFQVDLPAGSTIFAIDLRGAANAGRDAFLRLEAGIDATSVLVVDISRGSVGAGSCAGAVTVCNTGSCDPIETCTAEADIYYVTVATTAPATGTFSASVIPRGPVTVLTSGTAVSSTVEAAVSRTFVLDGVKEGQILDAVLSGVTDGSVRISLYRGHPADNECTALETCTSETGCSVGRDGYCDTEAGNYYIVAELASPACSASSFQLTVTATTPPYVDAPHNAAFPVALDASQTKKYRIDVGAASANNGTVAKVTDTSYLTLRVSNPSYASVEFEIYQSASGQCSRLLTRQTLSLTQNDEDCESRECGYFVIPCRLDPSGGDIYVYARNRRDEATESVTATLQVRTFAELPVLPPSATGNNTALDIYAVPAEPVAHLVQLHATSGNVRYYVHQVAACPASEEQTRAVDGYLAPSHGLRSVYEHNDRHGLPYGDSTGAVVIIEGPAGRTQDEPKPSSYAVTYKKGSDTCEAYDNKVTEDAFCTVPDDHTGHEVWAPFATSSLRASRARDLAEHIKAHFRCPRPTACGGCPGKISDICSRAIDDFACSSEYRRCDDDGFLLPMCQTYTCRAVEIECGSTFRDAGLPEFRCDADRYLADGYDKDFECTKWETLPLAPSPIPSPFLPSPSASADPGNGTAPEAKGGSGLSTGAIAGIAAGGAVALGAAAAAVFAMKKGGGGGDGRSKLDGPSTEMSNSQV